MEVSLRKSASAPETAAGGMSNEGADYGSTIVVEDVERGGRETYTLMSGAVLDIDAGGVSLASPLGQALLGTVAGDVVIVHTPQRERRLRVISVRTARDRPRTRR